MQNFLRRLGTTWAGALLVLALVSSAFAGRPSGFVAFGDSLSDPGNYYAIFGTVTVPPFLTLIPDSPYAIGGDHYSNGPTWIEQLSRQAGPAYRNPGVFFNYAVGRAHARLNGPYDLAGQVNRYLADVGGRGSAEAIYVVWIGGEDVRDAVQALATDRSGTQSTMILQNAISAIQNYLLALYQAGARNFFVPNVPDLGFAPAVRLQGQPVQQYATYFSQQFNAGLEQMLSGLQSTPGIHIARFDTFTLLHKIVGEPALFGLSNVSAPCINLNTTVQPYCAKRDRYLFWDGIHPTVAGHRIVALRATAALIGLWQR